MLGGGVSLFYLKFYIFELPLILMGKTLTTILLGLFLGTASSSCTPEGRSLALSLFRQGASDAIAHELNPHETNVHVYNQGQNNQRLPENVIMKNGGYNPAPGYRWVDPTNPKDFRVVEKQERELIREIITCNDFIDVNKNKKVDRGEIRGIKDIFKIDEEIACVFSYETIETIKGKNYSINLFDEKGNLIHQALGTTISNKFYSGEWERINPKKIGKYTVELYDSYNKKLLSHTFRVVE